MPGIESAAVTVYSLAEGSPSVVAAPSGSVSYAGGICTFEWVGMPSGRYLLAPSVLFDGRSQYVPVGDDQYAVVCDGALSGDKIITCDLSTMKKAALCWYVSDAPAVGNTGRRPDSPVSFAAAFSAAMASTLVSPDFPAEIAFASSCDVDAVESFAVTKPLVLRRIASLGSELSVRNNNTGDVSFFTVAAGASLELRTGIELSSTGNPQEGGAVYVAGSASFILNGGAIRDSKASVSGGGVYVAEGGTFVIGMNGGVIANNIQSVNSMPDNLQAYPGSFIKDDYERMFAVFSPDMPGVSIPEWPLGTEAAFKKAMASYCQKIILLRDIELTIASETDCFDLSMYASKDIVSAEGSVFRITPRGSVKDPLFKLSGSRYLSFVNVIVGPASLPAEPEIECAVQVENGAVFTLGSGAVIENFRSTGNGVVRLTRTYGSGGSLSLEGGIIRNCVGYNGGGVSIIGEGEIRIKSTASMPSITGNHATGSGGGVFSDAFSWESGVSFLDSEGYPVEVSDISQINPYIAGNTADVAPASAWSNHTFASSNDEASVWATWFLPALEFLPTLSYPDFVSANITLVTENMANSTAINWSSSEPSAISVSGSTGTVTPPAAVSAPSPSPTIPVTLTATITKGSASLAKTFNVTVRPAAWVYYDMNGGTGSAPTNSFNYPPGSESNVIAISGLVMGPSVPGHPDVHQRFLGWSLDPDAVNPQLTTDSAFLITGDTTLYAVYTSDADPLGKIGTGGGNIFYYDSANDYPDWTYLEAARWESAVLLWGVRRTDYPSSTLPGLGAGKENSDAIYALTTTDSNALNACKTYSYNGMSDWYLPSIDELSMMYDNLHATGVKPFIGEVFWSSTLAIDPVTQPYFGSKTFTVSTQAITLDDMERDDVVRVRPVRRY